MTRIGRQPIFGRQNQLVGYELLFRDRSENSAPEEFDGDLATSNVLANALLEVGLDRLVGEMPAFVNFTKSFLVGERPFPRVQRQVVVEVLEDIEIDNCAIDGIARLSSQGYRIALDDFVYSPAWDPCLELADIVKLDVLTMSRQDLTDHVMLLRGYDLTLLAEKVEDHETVAMCMELGFELFQGYYFAKPNVFEQRRATAGQGAMLATLAAINDSTGDAGTVARAVSQDALLTHKIMRYVNSSAMGLRSRVDCVRQAVAYLGEQTIRSIASLLLLASIEDKPPMLVRTALVRAQACQNYARLTGQDNPDAYFTAGLMSTLDALLDRPLESIVAELPITQELKRALIHHEGPIGMGLKSILLCECVESLNSLCDRASASRQAYTQATEAIDSGDDLAQLLPSLQPSVGLEDILWKPSAR